VPYGGINKTDPKPTRLPELGACWKLRPPSLVHLMGLLLVGWPHLAKPLQGTLPATVAGRAVGPLSIVLARTRAVWSGCH
jgi:hypothetical protein